MPVSQSDIDAIVDAMKGATRAVTFSDGRRVEYRSIAEMQAALAAMRDEMRASLPEAQVSRTVHTSFSRD